MRKSDVERDAFELMSSLKDDYEIPSSWSVVLPVLKIMLPVYIMHLLASALNGVVYYGDDGLMTLYAGLFFSAISCVVLTVTALMMSYGNVSVLLCVPKASRDRSILLRVFKKKLKIYCCVIVLINVVVAVALIFEDPKFILGYGFSWFACMIIGGLIFSMSMSRYITPAVAATLDKIRQVVSSGNDVTAENADVKQGH